MGRVAALILSLAGLALLAAGLTWAGYSLATAARNARRQWIAGKEEEEKKS